MTFDWKEALVGTASLIVFFGVALAVMLAFALALLPGIIIGIEIMNAYGFAFSMLFMFTYVGVLTGLYARFTPDQTWQRSGHRDHLAVYLLWFVGASLVFYVFATGGSYLMTTIGPAIVCPIAGGIVFIGIFVAIGLLPTQEKEQNDEKHD